MVKEGLKDNFIQNRNAEMNESSRAVLQTPNFVFLHIDIEMGRWARPKRIEFDNRKCKLCNKLEDEINFVLECPLYNGIR